MAETKYWLWLTKAVGNHRISANTLLEIANGNPKEIFDMSPQQLKALLGDDELVASLCVKDLKSAEREIAIANKHGVKIISRDDEDYPLDLINISDAPYVLYVRGNSDEMGDDKLRIAIIGSRRASSYGLGIAYVLAYALAKRGVVIVSGMATGIDSQAHMGAVDAGGKTIAVLGCGVNICYPMDNSALMVDIMKNGQVISEFPFDTPPLKWNFPQRNRIMSGLSHGVVVVEAEEISGTSITAKLALEQGKEVFAVPGNITSPTSVGTNNLIKNSATPVTCVEDILSLFPEFEFSKSEEDDETEHNENEIISSLAVDVPEGEIMPEQIILETVRTDAMSPEEIAGVTGLPLNQVNSIASIMEISGLLTSLPGHKYIKTSKLK